jgi:hypothetical protein
MRQASACAKNRTVIIQPVGSHYMDTRDLIFRISHMDVHCIKLYLYICAPNLTVKLHAFLTSALYNGVRLVSHCETAFPLLGNSPTRLVSHSQTALPTLRNGPSSFVSDSQTALHLLGIPPGLHLIRA